MELFRALAAFAEPPADGIRPLADALRLDDHPDQSAFTELFIFQLYPYASVYLGAEGMLGGEARDRIAGFWRAIGRMPPAEPDHLSVMLALYAGLAELEDEEAAGAPGRARLRHLRRTWFWEHLASWLPAYLAKVDQIAPPVYRRWADVLMAALAAEAATLGPPESLPLHLRESATLEDPGSEDSEELLATVLAPVRSGIVLVRADLALAARTLGLGLRVGDRRFVLRSLLDQDACGTLSWLVDQATGWSAIHARHESAFGTVSRFWTARARRTAESLGKLAASSASGRF